MWDHEYCKRVVSCQFGNACCSIAFNTQTCLSLLSSPLLQVLIVLTPAEATQGSSCNATNKSVSLSLWFPEPSADRASRVLWEQPAVFEPSCSPTGLGLFTSSSNRPGRDKAASNSLTSLPNVVWYKPAMETDAFWCPSVPAFHIASLWLSPSLTSTCISYLSPDRVNKTTARCLPHLFCISVYTTLSFPCFNIRAQNSVFRADFSWVVRPPPLPSFFMIRWKSYICCAFPPTFPSKHSVGQ